MVVGRKIGLIAVGSVVATACAGLLVQRSAIRRQGIEMLRDTMRVTVQSAENARNAISRLRNAEVFDDARLKTNLAGAADFRELPLYQTVPIVAAWNSIGEVAKREGYQFRVAAHQPRNARNLPDAQEEAIIAAMLSQSAEEYFAVDEKANHVLYARAIRLSADCLVCHGDPSRSPTGDGKDLLGFRMEGWKDGDRHGIFLLRSNLDRVDATVRAGMLQTALWLIPLSLLIGIAVYVLVARISSLLLGLTGSVAVAAEQVSSAVNQMSKASHALSTGTFEQTASINQTSAASEEIALLTKRNSGAARQAMGKLDEVQSAVQEGNASFKDMVASMSSIHASNQRISMIIRVIDDVAFQTNILALNAAVEAARAGEAGAGFAVVADEVRALAQRSAQAARDTAPLIEESIVKVNEGVAKLDQVAALVQGITDLATAAKQTVSEVAASCHDQARGIQQMSQAVTRIGSVTQSNAAMAEESAASTAEIAAQVESLHDMARQLRQLVDDRGVP